MSTVLLQSFSHGEFGEIKEMLTNHMIDVEATYDKKSTISYLRFETPQLLIIEKRRLEKRDLHYIAEIRNYKYDRPIIIIANETKVSPSLLSKPGSMIHLVDAPVNEKYFLNLVKKLLIKPSLKAQRFKRHTTNVSLDIESLSNGDMFNSTLVNLSVGGMYCEFNDDPEVKMGDLVRVNFELDEIDKSRTMNGQVVWKTKKSLRNPNPGLGIKFINAQDMYNLLLG